MIPSKRYHPFSQPRKRVEIEGREREAGLKETHPASAVPLLSFLFSILFISIQNHSLISFWHCARHESAVSIYVRSHFKHLRL